MKAKVKLPHHFIILILIAVMSMMMAMTVQANGTVWIGDTNVSAGGYWRNHSGSLMSCNEMDEWNVYYDTAKGIVYLKNAEITTWYLNSNGSYGLYSDKDLVIDLTGDSSIDISGCTADVKTSFGMYAQSITIQSTTEGSLTAKGGTAALADGESSGVTTEIALTVNSGKLTAISGGATKYCRGVHVRKINPRATGITVNGGCLIGTSETNGTSNFGFDTEGTLKVSGGMAKGFGSGGIVDNYGVLATEIVVEGGELDVTSGAGQGKNYGALVRNGYEIKIDGGKVKSQSNGTASESHAFNVCPKLDYYPTAWILDNGNLTKVSEADAQWYEKKLIEIIPGKILSGIGIPDNLVFPNGTGKDAISQALPLTLSIKTTGGNGEATIVWDEIAEDSYDQSRTDEQIFNLSGKITLPAGVDDLDHLCEIYQVPITVSAKPADTVVPDNDNQTGKPIIDSTNVKLIEPAVKTGDDLNILLPMIAVLLSAVMIFANAMIWRKNKKTDTRRKY